MANKRISVLHVISDTNFGGAGRYLLTLLGEPEYTGRVDAHVACPKPGLLWERLLDTDARLYALSGGDRSLDTSQLSPLFSVISHTRFDVVHTHASLTARIVARLFPRVKVVFTKHTQSAGGRMKRVSSVLQRLFADRIICPSNAVVQELIEGGLPRSMLDLVYNGVEADAIRKAARAARDARPKADGPIIISTGRLEYEKGHQWLIRAMPAVLKKHPRARLRIAGDGSLLQDLQNLATDLAISPMVEFPGFIEDVPAALGNADVFVLPSLEETLGISVLEAMAAGLPIVATMTGGVPELIRPDIDGILVAPKDPDAIAHAVLRMIDDPAFARGCSQNANLRVSDEFSARAQALGTIAVYEKLLARPERTKRRKNRGESDA